MKRNIQNMKKWGLLVFAFASMCGWPTVGHAKNGAAQKAAVDSICQNDYMNLKFTGDKNLVIYDRPTGGVIQLRDRQYRLLTNRKLLRVSGKPELKICVKPCFSWKENKKGVLTANMNHQNWDQFSNDRPAGYVDLIFGDTVKVMQKINSTERKYLYSFIVTPIQPWDWNNINLRLSTKDEDDQELTIDTNLKDGMKAINEDEPLVPRQVVNLEITRNEYAKLYDVKFNGTNVDDPRYVIGDFENLIDDSGVKQVILRAKLVMPDVAKEKLIPLSFKVNYINVDGSEKVEDKQMYIKVQPVGFASGAGPIILWVVLIMLFIGIGGGTYWFFRKNKGRGHKGSQTSAEESTATDKRGSSEKETSSVKETIGHNSVPDKETELNEKPVQENSEGHERYMPTQATVKLVPSIEHEEILQDDGKVRFEKIADEKVVELVLRYMRKIYPKAYDLDEETFAKRLNNGWVRQFNNELKRHPGMGCLDENQLNADALFQFIKNGFIGPDAKNLLDGKMNNANQDVFAYVTQIENYFATREYEIVQEAVMAIAPKINRTSCNSVEECKRELDILWGQLDKVRNVLRERNFRVNDHQATSLAELVAVIAQAVDEGESEELRNKELTDLKEKVQQLTDNVATKMKEQDELKQQQEQEIRSLNASHNEEMEKARKKWQEEKDKEIEQLNTSHNEKLSAQKQAYEEGLQQKDNECTQKLQEQQDGYEADLESQKQAHEGELMNKQTEITQLNGQINQLNVACHDDCARYINEVQERIASVDALIMSLMENTCQVSGEDSKFANSVRKIQTGFAAFKEQVEQSAESWNAPAARIDMVRSDLQDFITKGLKYGWVTIVSYMNLYAGATQELNTLFNKNGLNTAVLSNLNAEILRLIGLFGVKVVVPHLLTDDYNSDYFTFENADRWITSFDSQMNPSDFESKVFDMSCVGYQMDGGKYYKPLVFYC